jgi:hypothetical protein
MIMTLKKFPNVNNFCVRDSGMIRCFWRERDLSHYYFLEFGKSYYENHFNFIFNSSFVSGCDWDEQLKQKYKDDKESLKTTKITRYFVECFYHSDPFVLRSAKTKYFHERIEDEMLIKDYLNKIPFEKKIEFCDHFFRLMIHFHNTCDFIETSDGEFVLDIVNKNKLIEKLSEKIKNIC